MKRRVGLTTTLLFFAKNTSYIMIDNKNNILKKKGDTNMLIAIIVLTIAVFEAKKEHERILDKLERMERIEQKRKEEGLT